MLAGFSVLGVLLFRFFPWRPRLRFTCNQIMEVFDSAALPGPIDNIAFRRKPWQLEHAHCLGDPLQGLADDIGVA